MKRRSRNLIGVLATLLGIEAALWTRSYWTADSISHWVVSQADGKTTTKQYLYCVQVARGEVWVEFGSETSPPYPGPLPLHPRWEWHTYPATSDVLLLDTAWYRRYGFLYCCRPVIVGQSCTDVIFPFWGMFVLAGLPLLIIFYRSRGDVGYHRVCRVCEYDLRASPGRCPECGTQE